MRHGFLKPPHSWIEKMESDSSEMAQQNERSQNAAPHYSAPPFRSGLKALSGTTQTLSGGVQQAWVARYDEPGSANDIATAMVIDGPGNTYVLGYSDSSYSRHYLTVKYSAAGVKQWTARYNGYAVALAVDRAGNVYVTGSGETVKYNSAGKQEWIVHRSGSALGIDPASGDVYVTGSSWSGTSYDYATVKYNSAGIQQWVATYNGPVNNQDHAVALAMDPADGGSNLYVTGRSWDGKNLHYVTVKYNSAGNQEWVAIYNRPGKQFDNPQALAVDRTGNVYVMGTNADYPSSDYVTVKYNSAGAQKWIRTYNGLGNSDDKAAALAVDGAGNVYVTGLSWNGTNHDYATVKYDSAGGKKWVRIYNGPLNYNDYARALAVDGAGNVYVTGISWNGTNHDYATVKYNSVGTQKWVKTYNTGHWNDVACALVLDGSGNVYVTGSSIGACTSSDDLIVKYNAFGVEQWVARHDEPGPADNFATAMAMDGSGNVYVTGYNCSQHITVKYDAAGVRQWVAHYKGPTNGSSRAIDIGIDLTSGNIYVTGTSGVYPHSDYVTIKYNSSGQEQWIARYNGPGNSDDNARALAVDNDGNVYVMGTSGTVKYTSAGKQEWVATDGSGTALAVDSAGNVYVTGPNGTVKYTSAGKQE
jgi:hypothetical protein